MEREKIQPKRRADSFIGTYFHSRKPDGSLHWQGVIGVKLTDEKYLCHLFSWLDGEQNLSKIVALSEMSDWDFYVTQELMGWAYEKIQKYGAKS